MLYDIFAVVICGAILILCMLVPVLIGCLIGALIDWIELRRFEKRWKKRQRRIEYMARVEHNRGVTIDECNKYAEEVQK